MEHVRLVVYHPDEHTLTIGSLGGTIETRRLQSPRFTWSFDAIFGLGHGQYLLYGQSTHPVYGYQSDSMYILSTPTGDRALPSPGYLEAQHPLYPDIFFFSVDGYRYSNGWVQRLHANREDGQVWQVLHAVPASTTYGRRYLSPMASGPGRQFAVSHRLGPAYVHPVRERRQIAYTDRTYAVADAQGRPAALDLRDDLSGTRLTYRDHARKTMDYIPIYYGKRRTGRPTPLGDAILHEGRMAFQTFDGETYSFPVVSYGLPYLIDLTEYHRRLRYWPPLVAVLSPDLARYVFRAV